MIDTYVARSNAVTITNTISTLLGGQGFLTAPISIKDVNGVGVWGHRLFYSILMGATVPILGDTIEIYSAFYDGDTLRDGNVPGTALVMTGASSPTITRFKANAKLEKTIDLLVEANGLYQGSVFIPLDAAAAVQYGIVLNTAANPNTTPGNHQLRYVSAWNAST